MATSNVWFVFFEWSKLYETAQLVALLKSKSTLPRNAWLLTLCCDRQSFFLIAGGAEEVEQREALAVVVAVDQRLVREDRRRGDRARCRADRFAEIRALRFSRMPSKAKK